MEQLSYGDHLCAEREREEDRAAEQAHADELAAEQDDLDESSEVMA